MWPRESNTILFFLQTPYLFSISILILNTLFKRWKVVGEQYSSYNRLRYDVSLYISRRHFETRTICFLKMYGIYKRKFGEQLFWICRPLHFDGSQRKMPRTFQSQSNSQENIRKDMEERRVLEIGDIWVQPNVIYLKIFHLCNQTNFLKFHILFCSLFLERRQYFCARRGQWNGHKKRKHFVNTNFDILFFLLTVMELGLLDTSTCEHTGGCNLSRHTKRVCIK